MAKAFRRMMESIFKAFLPSLDSIIEFEPVVVSEKTTIQQMLGSVWGGKNTDYVLVVDNHDTVIGVVFAKDILAQIVAGTNLQQTTVAAIMQSIAVQYNYQCDDFNQVVNLWKIHQPEVLPVVEGERGRVIGAIAGANLCRILPELQSAWENCQVLAGTENDVLIVCDRHGQIIDVNTQALKVLGYSHSELVNRCFSTIEVTPSPQEVWECVISGVPLLFDIAYVLQNNEHLKLRTQYQRIMVNGSHMILVRAVKLSVTSPLKDKNNQVYRICSVSTDISEHQKIEAELRRSIEQEKEINELKSQFVLMASHEFRTPLSTILSSSELLEYYRHKWSEDKQTSHLQRIKTAALHLNNLLDDVLLMGKAEAGKLEYNPQQINLSEFCEAIVENILVITKLKNRIIFTPPDIPIWAYLDEHLIEHILTNILTNAVKYSPPETSVYFDLITTSTHITFTIQDQGIGIPNTDIPHLFESFHRGTNVGNIQGTGLGLAIVKQCVKLHQGDINVESELGVGSKFQINLPILQPGAIFSENNTDIKA